MPFDYKIALRLVRKNYLGPTVVVILLLSGGMAYVWKEHKDVLKEHEEVLKEMNKIAADRKSLNQEIVISEKNRANASIALAERKADLDKREFTLQQLEGQNQEKLAALQQRASEFDSAFEKLKLTQSAVSKAQREKEAEDKIQSLIYNFSDMGVNLNNPLRCGDAEGEKRFNKAKILYTEIYALAEANGLKEKYNNFFFHNGQSMYATCIK